MSTGSARRRYLGRFAPYRTQVIVAIVASVAQAALLIPLPILIGRSIDQAIPNEDVGELVVIAAAMIALAVASVALSIAARAIDVRLTMQVSRQVRHDLHRRLLELPRSSFDARSTGELHDLMVSDTTRVQTMASTIITTLVPSAVLTVGLSVILLLIEWRLALVTLAFAPVLFGIGKVMNARIRRQTDEFHPAFQRVSSRALLMLRSQDLIRLAGAEDHELEQVDVELEALRRVNTAVAFSNSTNTAIQQGIIAVAGAVLLLAGGYAVVETPLTLGELLSFYAAFAMLRGPSGTFASSYAAVIEGQQALDRIDTLLHDDAAPVYQGTARHDLVGALALHHVTLSYPASGRPEPVLHDISLALSPGRIVALVGPNGSGKSSIVNLLLGFYRPDQGSVTVDGRPYDDIDMQWLRRQLGVVTQAPFLLPDTVLANITYGREWTQESLDRALALSGAAPVVDMLPAGLQTRLGDDGARLSGGQRQRIAIARALLGDPAVLILDEPSNHLDDASIRQLLAGIRSSRADAAVLIVSHDRELLDEADELVGLDAGRIVFRR